MKVLDIWARRKSLPTYTAGRRPSDGLLALMLLTELRYESFSPNHVRVPKDQENFNEPLQLGIHTVAFAVLQSLPQGSPTVLAFEVLLAIYIIWTSMQLLLRYKSSPALFGPLYKIDSLTGFWSESWHNAFAAPCTSLAYSPLRYGLPKIGVPVSVARSLGVIGAFTLMVSAIPVRERWIQALTTSRQSSICMHCLQCLTEELWSASCYFSSSMALPPYQKPRFGGTGSIG